LATAAAAKADLVGFDYLSQDRSVSANSSATGYARGGTSSAPVTDNQGETQTAGNMGDFTGTTAANSTLGPQGASAAASAVQNSSLTTTGFTDSGAISSDTAFGTGGPANSSSSSVFQVSFKVAHAESFTLTANLGASTDPAEANATLSTISLTNKAGKSVFTPITSVKLSDYVLTGALKPGTYDFIMDASTISNDANFNMINYSVSLDDGPVTGSDTPAAGSAVPLPSSALTALTMLTALAGAGLIRRRLPGWIKTSMF
jgi:hypothetical protein